MKWLFLTLCALAGIVFGLGSYTFWYAQGGSYFSNNPKACMNCHIMRDAYDTWQKASHHGHATCNDCHLPHDFIGKYLAKAENGFFHSKAFTLQDFPDPLRIHAKNARILQLQCLGCHKELVEDLVHQGAFQDESDSCVRCHAAVGHGSPR